MEMLIVIGIVAVLTAIIVPSVTSSLRKAKESADIANIYAAYATHQAAVIEDEVEPTFQISEDGYVSVNYSEGTFTADLFYIMTGGKTTGAVTMERAEGFATYVPKLLNDGNPYIWSFDN